MTTTITKEEARLKNYNKILRYIACQSPGSKPITDSVTKIDTPTYSTWEDVLDQKSLDKVGFVAPLKIFLETSLRLNDLENLNQTSDKLSDMQKLKLDELKEKLEILHNSQYGSIKTYQSSDFNDNKVSFLKSISLYILLLFSTVFILLSLSVTEVISQIKFISISVLLGFIVIAYIIVSIRQNMYRRNNDWNKFYFNPPNIKSRM